MLPPFATPYDAEKDLGISKICVLHELVLECVLERDRKVLNYVPLPRSVPYESKL